MDIKHYYKEKGEGSTLILLHGNGENCETFSYQLEELSKYFRVIALDTRGHGKTPRGNAPFTLSQFTDDLNGFMQEKGIEKADILGFSDGGNIAIGFALRYPEKVNRLILNGANLSPSGLVPYFIIPVKIMYEAVKHMKSEKSKSKAALLRLMVEEPDFTPEELNKINKPTLVIAGTHDLILRKETERIAAGINQSSLVFIKGSHSIHKTHPAAFNKAVLQFLKP